MERMTRALVATLLIGIVFLSVILGAEAKETVGITDLANRTVQVPVDVKRVVCLAPGSLRLVCYLQKQDLVVGVENMEKKRPAGRPYWLANPQLAKLPTAGPGDVGSINAEPDLEALLKVSPDIVFITYMKPELADSVQKKLGIPVVVLSYGPFASFSPVIYKSLRLMGKILNAESRAEEIVSFVDNCQKDLKERTRGIEESKKPGVYVGGVGFKGVQGTESTDATYLPLEWIDAKNVARQWKDNGHLFINKEQLLSSNPDIIFVDGGGLPVLKEDMQKKPEFYKGLKAFKTKQVYLLHPFNWYVANIGTTIADAYTAGKILYPDKFSDIEPAKKADEMYTFLLGKPVYDLMKRDYGELGGKIAIGD